MSSFGEGVSSVYRPLEQKFRDLSRREQVIVAGGVGALILFGLVVLIQELFEHVAQVREELRTYQVELEQSGPLLARLKSLEERMKMIEDTELSSAPPAEGLRPYIERLTQQASIRSPSITSPQVGGGGEVRRLDMRHPMTELRVMFSAPDVGPLLDFLQLLENSEQPLYVTHLTVQRVGNSVNAELDLLGLQRQREG